MDVDKAITSAQCYGIYDADFQQHYQQHCAKHGRWYDQYRPAYRFGYDLGIHPYYGAGTWLQIEAEARTLWEARNPGSWEQFKGAIQYAWATAQASTHALDRI